MDAGAYRETLLDAVGFIPVIGSLKYADEFAAILKNADEVASLAKRAPELVDAARAVGKLDDVLGSVDEFGGLLENAPEVADLVKNTGELGALAKRTEDANTAAQNFIEKAVNAQTKYVDTGTDSMNDLIDTSIANKKSWYKTDGTIKMPPNDGAVLGTKETTNLQPGKRLGRYGGYTKNSDFLAEAGSSADRLSLPPFTDTSVYQEFEVLKPILRVAKSLVEPWGTSEGWGTQFKLPMTIKDLINQLYIKEVLK